tara:strand:+ start:1932 stop:2795 length:864 start_codon:yes stop_codon:yes gene_type:complete
MSEKLSSFNKNVDNGLYLISTPIGNLKDITFRAIEILKESKYILCEDTRVSKNLFNKYQIDSKLISNHKFNEKKNLLKIIDMLKSGSIISIVSDAGTPCISDPGKILVNECVKNKVKIIPIPGPSAVTSAISISGFSNKFFFYGFFPEKLKDLEVDLDNLSKLNCSIVFFISSKKFKKTISTLKSKFVGRRILICREMTKYYEEYIRTSIDELTETENDLKGELTVVISEKTQKKITSQELDESDKRIIKRVINKLSTKEITDLINFKHKVSKKEIYNFCLKIKNEK